MHTYNICAVLDWFSVNSEICVVCAQMCFFFFAIVSFAGRYTNICLRSAVRGIQEYVALVNRDILFLAFIILNPRECYAANLT
jgi:hypothetical protein